eukprot:7152075-Karenia_brevis.AAC.1
MRSPCWLALLILPISRLSSPPSLAQMEEEETPVLQALETPVLAPETPVLEAPAPAEEEEAPAPAEEEEVV